VIIISDTNILSSLAAGESFLRLRFLFAPARLAIPHFVQRELQDGFDKGLSYLEPVLLAIQHN
jgi:predicted nucleic acid-binding protein